MNDQPNSSWPTGIVPVPLTMFFNSDGPENLVEAVEGDALISVQVDGSGSGPDGLYVMIGDGEHSYQELLALIRTNRVHCTILNPERAKDELNIVGLP